jgi:hypothetical protein
VSGLSFDWRISVGQIGTAAIVILSVYTAWLDLNRDVVDHEKRLAVIEATVGGLNTRMNIADVSDAEMRTQFKALDSLLTEVRNELRTMNRNRMDARAPYDH